MIFYEFLFYMIITKYVYFWKSTIYFWVTNEKLIAYLPLFS